eukprot:scaffold456_cov368-Pavlova_lutheri.AAC.28
MRASSRLQRNLSMRPHVRKVSCVRTGPVRASAGRTVQRRAERKDQTVAWKVKDSAMWMLVKSWNLIYMAFNWIVDRLDYASEYRKRYYKRS